MLNVTRHLTRFAAEIPDRTAVAEPIGPDVGKRDDYRTIDFGQLEEDSNRIASGLWKLGVEPGHRLALLVRPGIDFVTLVFGLLKSGAVTILIDPGMGKRNLIRCLAEAEPDGFVAIPPVHAVRSVLRGRFPRSRFHVTVGKRWFWGGVTLDQLKKMGRPELSVAPTEPDSPAAIIFTTGSTGPPKGVLYTQQTFDSQVVQIRDHYAIAPGGTDVPGFPLFGLFNAAMGVTTIIPRMDPTRPAQVDPRNIVAAARAWEATQMFGSPAMWNRVGRYCREHDIRLDSVRRIYSAGAPVPDHVLENMTASIHPEGEMYTPYGATEALPVASIAASEVLGETIHRTREGAGVCVGRRFPDVRWQVIRITDEPIRTLAEAEPLPPGEIGELIVTGPAVTRKYVTRTDANPLAKITDGDAIWHRMGDVGYLDEDDRFWYCGRKAHRVVTATETLFTIPCEAILNQVPGVFRSALVGVGPQGRQVPVAIIERSSPRESGITSSDRELLEAVARAADGKEKTRSIRRFLIHPGFPVDIRHNSKIFREQLAEWAAKRLDKAYRRDKATD